MEGVREMKRRSYTLAVAAVALTGLLAVTALAATTGTINGTPKNEVLKGTPKADVMNGQAGNDLLYGYAGNDTLIGGPGNDKLSKDCEVVKGLAHPPPLPPPPPPPPPPTPPAPAALPGTYCGFNDQGKSVCLDVTSDGHGVTNVKTESIVDCQPE